MKTMTRHTLRKGLALSIVATLVVVDATPIGASAPTDSTTTTVADTTTTTAAPGDTTTTTTPADGTTPTTIPGLTNTELAPLLPEGAKVDNIDQPPSNEGEVKTELPAGSAGNAKTGVDLISSAQLVGPALPNQIYMGMTYITNIGSDYAGQKSPITFTMSNLPATVTFSSAAPAITDESAVGSIGWVCSGLKCTYTEKTADGTKNALLPPGSNASADLQFQIGPDAAFPLPPDSLVTDVADKTKAGDIEGAKELLAEWAHILFKADTADDIDRKNDEAIVQLLGPDPDAGASVGSAAGDDKTVIASVWVDVKVVGRVYPGGKFKADMRLLPTGTETQSGDFTFRNVLPKDLGITNVKVSGEGWTCDNPSAPTVCTHKGPDLPPSTFSDTLTLEGRVSKTAKVTEKPVIWEVESISKTLIDDSPLEAGGQATVIVVPAPEPDLSVRLSPRDGNSSISAPGSAIVDANIRSAYGPGENVAVTFSTRKGMVFKGLKTDAEGWTCSNAEPDPAAGEGATAQKCVKAELDGDTAEIVGMEIAATEETEDGAAQVIATISADNEADKYKAGNSVSHTLIVQPLPAAMPGIVFSRADEKGASQAVTDGSATPIMIGKDSTYSFAVENLGAKAMPAGTTVRIEQYVDNTAVLSGASFPKALDYKAKLDGQKLAATAGKWTCVAGNGTQPSVEVPAAAAAVADAVEGPTTVPPTSAAPTVTAPKSGPAVRCEIKLASDMAPGGKTPVLAVTARASNKAKVGTPEWPVFASLPEKADAPVARFGMTVSIIEYKPELVPSFIAPAGPRPGGNAVATLSVKNGGNADATAQYVVVPGIKNGRITGVEGDGWKCVRVGGKIAAGFTVCSRNSVLKSGEESPTVSIKYDSLDSATKSLTLRAASLVATDRGVGSTRVSNLPVELRPAIAFTVKGPGEVVDQIIDAKGNRVASTILLSTEGNASGSSFVWKQLCTTDADVKASKGECKSVTPAAKWLNNQPSTGPTATLVTPKVTAQTTLVFEVTATEAGATGSARVSVSVVPLPTAEGPAGKAASGSGSSVIRRVPAQSAASVRAYANTAPTSGSGDTSYTTSADTGVTVNGNIFGTTTVAQGAAVSLTALGSGVGAVSYAWTQAAGPSPSVLASATTNAATVSFTAPAANVTLSLRVTATDSRGLKATDTVSIVVGTGGTPTVSANITQGDGPIVVDTASSYTLNATGAGSGTISYSWTQVGGTSLTLQNANTAALTIAATAATGSATIMVTTTDASGASATDQIVLQLAPSGAPTPLCNFVEAVSTKTLTKINDLLTTIGIGGLDLNQFAVSSSTCTDASKVTFSNAGFSIGGYFAVSGASGTVSATGLNIRSARFIGPSDWGSPQFAIGASDPVGLFVPFSRASVTVGAFEGEIVSGSMPFLKLPAGFTPDVTVRFSVDAEGNKAMSLDAKATAAEKNGKVPSARVYGALSTTGTYALEASMTSAIDLFGATVDFAGSVRKTEATGKAKVALSGSLTGAVTLANKVTLTNLAAGIDETGVISGTGTVAIGEGDTALSVTASLNYTDAKNHTVSLTAATSGGTWKPAADVSIPLASASGTYVVTNGAKNINFTVVGSDTTPFTGLKLIAPTVKATATCADGAACSLKVDVTANAEVTLGSTATTGALTGTFDLDTKSANFTASIGKIPVVAGLELTSASLTVKSTNMGSANATTVTTLSGSMTAFDKTVTASASFSKAGIVLSADLPEIAPFGASGPVFKPGQLNWASGAISITPKVPSMPNLKAITLTPKVPRLNAAIAMPKEITDFATTTLSGVSDILLDGDVDFSTGKFNLAAALSTDTIDVSGSIGREGTGQGYKYSLTGKVKKPITLNSSVKVTTLNFTFGNTTAGTAPKFAGTGGVDVTLPDSTVLSVNGALTYNSSTDFSLTLTVGATSPSFTVNGGDALSLGTATGTFTRNSTGTTLNVALSSSATWKPVSGLSVTGVSATAALTCATGATCVPTFNVKGTLGFDLGITGLSSAAIEGNLDAKGFTFSAKFNDQTFAPDIKLVAPTLTLTIPAKSSTDKASATLSGNFVMFGATVGGSMSFSSAGVLLVGTFPAFKFPNSDVGFDGGQFAWLLKAPGSLSFTPKVPNLTLSAVNLNVGAPKINLSMPMPDAIKQLTGGTNVTFGAISVAGDMTLATGAFSMAASYATSAVDVSGSVSRAAAGASLQYSLSAKVKTPTTVVDGVKIDSLDMSLSNATGSVVVNGTGGLTFSTSTDPISLGFALTYNSATDYSFSVATAAGKTSSWTPFAGLTIPLNGITGSMSRSGNNKALSIAIKSTSDFVPFPGVKVSEPGASITSTCTVGSSCVIAFNATGKVFVDVGQGFQGPAVVSGTFGTDGSTLTATFPDITITSGVVISKPALSLAYSKANGISASVSGATSILGTTLTLSATFSSSGVVIAGGLNDWTPIPGGPTLTATQFVYSTYALTNFTLPSAPTLGKLNLPKNAPVLAAGFAVPQWLRDFLKQPTLMSVPVTINLKDLAGGKLPTMQIMLPTPDNWYIMNTSAVSMRFTALGFEISGSPSPAMSLIGNFELKTGANSTPVPFEVRGTVSTTSFTLSASLGKDPATGNAFAWNNAFGISGFTLTEAAVSIGFTYTSPIGIPLPIIGIAANAQLPAAWRTPLGMDSGVAVRLVANLDISKPCFSFQAGTLGADNRTISAGTAKVISVGGGVLTSTYMDLTIAPLGCTVGNVTLDPGVSVGFSGTILGTPVNVRAKIGTDPFSLEASLAVGGFKAGPVQLDDTVIAIKVSPTDNYVAFAGGITIGSTKVAVAGKAGINVTDGPYLDMTGSISNLVIVPSFIEIKSAAVNMSLKPAKGTASIIASGDFTMLGSPSKIDVNVQMANYQFQSIAATIQARRTVGVVTIDGTFNVAYTKGQAPNIAFDATGSVASYQLGRVTGFLNANQVNITGTVAIGGVFSAQVSGQMVWSAAPGITIGDRNGNQVAAQSGDFRIAATNVSLNLGGFAAGGSIALGKVGSLFYADFSASFQIGSGDVGGALYVSGSFDSNGNFSFNGSGWLNLVAFQSTVYVSGSKSGNNWSFSMSSTINVMGAINVGFGGNFRKDGATTRFTMWGSADLRAAGIGGGRGDFRISNEPGQAGMYASIAINIAGINGGGAMWIGADGTFETSVWVSVNFPGVSSGGWIKVGNVYWSGSYRYRGGTYFQLDAWINLAGVWFRLWGNVNGDGSFQFTAQAGPWSWGTCINFGIVEICAGARFESYVRVTSWAPYVSVSAGGWAWLDGHWWSCWWTGGWRPKLRCGWGDWSRWVNAGIGFNTNPGNLWLDMWGIRFSLR
jgi:hypothetical protein